MHLFRRMGVYVKRLGLVFIIISIMQVFQGIESASALVLPVINDIEVTGNEGIETSTILFRIGSKVGERLNPYQVRRDMKALYATGFFEDIRVETERLGDGVRLLFLVEERPIITDVVISGAKKISPSTLMEEITVKEGQRFDPVKVKESCNKIEDKYKERGYQYAYAAPRLTGLRKGKASLIIVVDEGNKVRIEKIQFIGNKSFAAGTRFWGLRSKMKENREHWMFSWITSSGTFKQDKLEEDIAAIEEFYKDKGYLEVSIDQPEIIVSKPDPQNKKGKQSMTIIIRIHEGEVYRLGKIDAEVTDETIVDKNTVLLVITKTRLEKYQKYFGGSAFFRAGPRFETGKVYSYALEKEVITNLSDVYGSLGYIYVDINPDKKIDEKNKIVDITFRIIEGQQTFLHRLEFKGNVRTRDRVLRRNFLVAEGDVFNTALIKQAIARIQYLGYIDDVVPDIRPTSDPSLIDVDVSLSDEKQTEIQVAGGYSAYEKFYGTLGLSEHNLFGRGQTFTFSATSGKRRKSFQVSFTDEWIFDRPYYGSVAFWNTTRDFDYSDRRTTGGRITLGKALTTHVSTRLGYKWELNRVFNIENTAEEEIQDLKGTQVTSSLTNTWIRDTLDNRRDPTTGTLSQFRIEYAGGILGGENEFYKAELSMSYYRRLPKNLVFMLRGEIDYADGLGGKTLPFYERYILGGPLTIRGYRERSVGPWDENGDNLGGNKALLCSAEIQIPIAGPLKIVLFGDAGDAYAEDDTFDLRTLRPSVGAELRFYVPGFWIPLRFIWGYNLDPLENEDVNDFQFTMGTIL